VNTRRQLALAAAVLVLLAAWDFFGRVYVGRDESLRSFEQPRLETLTVRPDAATVRGELVSWMPALAGSAGVTAAPTDPSGWELTLVGVFRKDDGKFALVHARPRSGGGEPQFHWVGEGDDLHGSTVAQIGPRNLRLDRGGESQELLLFEQGRSPLIATGPGSPTVKPAVRTGGVASYERGSGRVDEVRAQLRANQARSSQAKPAPVARKPAPAKPAASAGQPKSPSASAGERSVAKPQELAPGEEVKLPWDLPVVDEAEPQPEKRP
jgi:hypothetical protein